MLSDSGLRALYFIILSFKHCLHCCTSMAEVAAQYNMKLLPFNDDSNSSLALLFYIACFANIVIVRLTIPNAVKIFN